MGQCCSWLQVGEADGDGVRGPRSGGRVELRLHGPKETTPEARTDTHGRHDTHTDTHGHQDGHQHSSPLSSQRAAAPRVGWPTLSRAKVAVEVHSQSVPVSTSSSPTPKANEVGPTPTLDAGRHTSPPACASAPHSPPPRPPSQLGRSDAAAAASARSTTASRRSTDIAEPTSMGRLSSLKSFRTRTAWSPVESPSSGRTSLFRPEAAGLEWEANGVGAAHFFVFPTTAAGATEGGRTAAPAEVAAPNTEILLQPTKPGTHGLPPDAAVFHAPASAARAVTRLTILLPLAVPVAPSVDPPSSGGSTAASSHPSPNPTDALALLPAPVPPGPSSKDHADDVPPSDSTRSTPLDGDASPPTGRISCSREPALPSPPKCRLKAADWSQREFSPLQLPERTRKVKEQQQQQRRRDHPPIRTYQERVHRDPVAAAAAASPADLPPVTPHLTSSLLPFPSATLVDHDPIPLLSKDLYKSLYPMYSEDAVGFADYARRWHARRAEEAADEKTPAHRRHRREVGRSIFTAENRVPPPSSTAAALAPACPGATTLKEASAASVSAVSSSSPARTILELMPTPTTSNT